FRPARVARRGERLLALAAVAARLGAPRRERLELREAQRRELRREALQVELEVACIRRPRHDDAHPPLPLPRHPPDQHPHPAHAHPQPPPPPPRPRRPPPPSDLEERRVDGRARKEGRGHGGEVGRSYVGKRHLALRAVTGARRPRPIHTTLRRVRRIARGIGADSLVEPFVFIAPAKTRDYLLDPE